MSLILELWALVIAGAFILSPLFSRRLKRRGRILALHSLKPHGLDFSAVSLNGFEKLLDNVHARGLRVGNIAEAIAREDTIAITFDDGYDDLLQLAPVLRKNPIPITVFMPTAFVGKFNSWDNVLNRNKRRHLDADQIRELAALGVEFGSHSHSHCDLAGLSDDAIKEELANSKRILESLTGREVRYLGYPFGRCNARVVAVARRLGYQNGFYSAPLKSDGFNYGRTSLNRLDSELTLRVKLASTLLSGSEYLKALIVNRFSHLTPLLARFSSGVHGR